MAASRQIANADIQPLLKPTFPGARSLACLGHSFLARSYGGAPGVGRYVSGYPGWLPILSRQRIVLPASMNFAVSGQTSTQIISRIPQIISAKPGLCLIDMITNDTASDFATIKSNHEYAINALLSAGIIPIVSLWTGRGGPANSGASSITTAQYQMFLRVNDYLRSLRDSGVGMYVIDNAPYYVDPTTGYPNPLYSPDNLHPNTYGCFSIAKGNLVPILTSLFPDPLQASVNVLDVYDATNNPNGNIYPNPLMSGTAGTIGGTSVTGSLANSLSCSKSVTGLTVTLSKATMADGRPAQQIQLSGTYTGNAVPIDINTTSSFASRFTAGDQTEMTVDFEVDAGTQNVSAFGPVLNLNAATPLYPSDGAGDPTMALPPVAYSGLFRTDRATGIVPASLASAFPAIRATLVNSAGTSPVAFTARFTSVSVKRFGATPGT